MSGQGEGTLRSDFLIHWTGKDIQTDYRELSGAQRKQYVDRLRNTLTGEIKGLWMTIPGREQIRGPREASIEYEAIMTCFSEIKLSSVAKHTGHYGCLGFGFSRRFVMERGGAPVQYVCGTEHDFITENFHTCFEQLSAVWLFINSGSSDVLGEKNVHELHGRVRGVIKSLDTNICFIKGMSDPKNPRFPYDFTFLDEAEWRIVKTMQASRGGRLKEFGYILQKDGSLKNIKARRIMAGQKYPEALIPFESRDLRILIFPDGETRRKAFEDPDIRQWFGTPPEFPMMATVAECLHF